MSSKLLKSIVAPRQLASIFNWKGGKSSLLCIRMSDNGISLAVTDNPVPGGEVHRLDSLKYTKTSGKSLKLHSDLKETVYGKLQEIVRNNNIGGIVVAWPTVSDGRPGGSCGKVLHLLDYIAEHNGSLLSKSRPFTLWETRKCCNDTFSDDSTMNKDAIPDEWGRSVAFSRLPEDQSTPRTFSSSDQYNHQINKESTAEMILESFIDSNWMNKIGDTGKKQSSFV
jgi:hypothetical protein